MEDPDFEMMPLAEMVVLLRGMIGVRGHWSKSGNKITLGEVETATKIRRTDLRKLIRGEPNGIRNLGLVRLTRYLRKADLGLLVKTGKVIEEVETPTKAPTIIRSIKFLINGRPVIQPGVQQRLDVARLPNVFKTGLNGPKGLL